MALWAILGVWGYYCTYLWGSGWGLGYFGACGFEFGACGFGDWVSRLHCGRGNELQHFRNNLDGLNAEKYTDKSAMVRLIGRTFCKAGMGEPTLDCKHPACSAHARITSCSPGVMCLGSCQIRMLSPSACSCPTLPP